MNGIELSTRFFFEVGLPLLKERFPDLVDRMAAGLVAGGFRSGSGSEVSGFDDEISRDHNWGPRFFLFMSDADKEEFGAEVQAHLDDGLPESFAGIQTTATTLPRKKAYVVTPIENLRSVLELESSPKSAVEWLLIPEVALHEYTVGPVFYEPTPIVSPLRERFEYYPDEVWYKRLSYAFFMLHLSGNVIRSARRNDIVATHMYANWFLQIAMRTCFLLERRYAPYCKWMFKALKDLEGVPRDFCDKVEEVAGNASLEKVESQIYEIQDMIGIMANKSGLIEVIPLRNRSPFTWTDFNCYGFMHAFHSKLSDELKDTDPYEHGPLDLQVIGGRINQETMQAAWRARPHL